MSTNTFLIFINNGPIWIKRCHSVKYVVLWLLLKKFSFVYDFLFLSFLSSHRHLFQKCYVGPLFLLFSLQLYRTYYLYHFSLQYSLITLNLFYPSRPYSRSPTWTPKYVQTVFVDSIFRLKGFIYIYKKIEVTVITT